MSPSAITHHARVRARERLASPLPDARIRGLLGCARKLPERLAATLIGRRQRPLKGGVTYWIAGDVLLVRRGRTVVTLWRLDNEALATWLVWRVMDVWVAP